MASHLNRFLTTAILASMVSQTACQLNILTDIDTATQTFPFPKLNRNTSAGTKVGQVRAQDAFDVQRQIRYSLIDVSYIHKDGYEIQGGEAASPHWKIAAESLSVDDCQDQQLSIYPEYRRYFCIDHTTGDVFTTAYFSSPLSESRFNFRILYRSFLSGQQITYPQNVSPYSVTIFSNCDQMEEIYRNMVNSCLSQGVIKQDPHSSAAVNRVTSLTVDVPESFEGGKFAYLSEVELKFLDGKQSWPVGSKMILNITYESKQYRSEVFYTSSEVSTYLFQLEPPFLTQDGSFTLQFSVGSASNIISFYPLGISILYLPEMDYCAVIDSCSTLAKNYLKAYKVNKEECPNNDTYLLASKYGFCDENTAPVFIKTNVTFDFDKFEQQGQPALVLPNYIHDANAKPLHFHIVKVLSKYDSTGLVYNVTNHPKCTSTFLINVRIPEGYFCINSTDGSIYTTVKAIRSISPDEQFNITVEVQDFAIFPPRKAQGMIQVNLKSLCSLTVALYRKFFNSNCIPKNSVAYGRLTLFNTTSDNNYEVGVDLIASARSDQYYITGFLLHSVLQPISSLKSSHVRFQLRHEAQTIEATHYYTGRYMTFNSTILHKLGQRYFLSAKLVSEDTGKIVSLDMSKYTWYLVLIERRDYCTGKDVCIELYSKYDEEYQRTKSAIERICYDPDQRAGKYKFGFCKASQPLTLNKSTYDITVNNRYWGIEVIPRDSITYVSNHGFIYKLLQVNLNEIVMSTSPVNLPQECSSGSQKGYFCINSTTGKIYTTDFAKGRISLNDRFTLKVEISNFQVFPPRQLTANLTLNFRDICSPASNTYSKLVSCVQYQEIPGSSLQNESTVVFDMPIQFQATLALNILKDGLVLQPSASNITMSALILYQNGSTSKPLVQKQLTLGYDLAIVSTLFVPGVKRISDKVLVTFHETSISHNIKPIKINSLSKFSLKYIESFKCDTSCIALYDEWKAQAMSKDASAKCTDDPQFYRKNFEVCADPQPAFTSNPVLSTASVTVSSDARFSSCKYVSPYEMPDSYWLKDGLKRLDGSSELIISRRRRDIRSQYPNVIEYSVNPLNLKNVSIDDIGYYQCVIRDTRNAVLIKSEKVYLQLSDVSLTEISLTLDETIWNTRFLDTASSEYLDLSQKLQTELQQKLTEINCCGNPANRKIEVSLSSPNGNTTAVNARILIGQVDETTRLTYCVNIKRQLIDVKLTNFRTSNFKLRNDDCCTSVTEGEDNFKGLYIFEATLTGRIVEKPCVYNTLVNGWKIQRRCTIDELNGPIWVPLNLEYCKPKSETTGQLLDLQNQIVTVNNVEEISQNLSQTLQTGRMTIKEDIENSVSVIGNIVNSSANPTDKVAENVISAVSNLMNDGNEQIIMAAEQNKQSSRKLLKYLDNLALTLRISETERPKVIKNKNMGLVVTKAKSTANSELRIMATLLQDSVNIDMTNASTDNNDRNDMIILPEEVVRQAKNDNIFSFVFRSAIFFQREQGNATNDTSNIQSVVFSASVGRQKILNLTDKVKLWFTPTIVNNRTDLQAVCKFWDPNLNGTVAGGWSTDGCETIPGTDKTRVHCQCNHLTNFALLLDVSQTGSNPLALQIVTWIGCGVSMAGLLLTVITFICIPHLRRKLPPKILINLCISLMAVLVIFLAGVENTKPRVGCQVIAGLLQYFVLTTFFWMAVEGLNLYRNFVKVFAGGSSSRKFLIKASLFAWGTPLLIVIATGAAVPDKLGPASDEDPQFCVLRGTPFYFALLVPVAVIMLMNIIVLVLVLWGIRAGSRISQGTKKEKNKKLTNLRIAFACSALLGTTWIFAILAVGGLRDFFQWMFCIFNSLQGLFIFIFYCCRNNEVRRQWKRFFSGQGFDSQSSFLKSKYSSRHGSTSTPSQASTMLLKQYNIGEKDM